MRKGTKISLVAGALALAGAAGYATLATADHRGHGWRGMHHGMSGHHMRGRHGHKFVKMLEQFDTNEDGKLTQQEFDEARAGLLEKHDANKDGKLTLDEFEKLWLEIMRQRMVRGFQRLDKDGDAELSKDEYTKPFENLVERMDRNDDGALDYKDRRHHKGHKGHHGGGMHHRGGMHDKDGDKQKSQDRPDRT